MEGIGTNIHLTMHAHILSSPNRWVSYSAILCSGQYSAKFAYEGLFNGAIQFRAWKMIWKRWALGKCMFYVVLCNVEGCELCCMVFFQTIFLSSKYNDARLSYMFEKKICSPSHPVTHCYRFTVYILHKLKLLYNIFLMQIFSLSELNRILS